MLTIDWQVYEFLELPNTILYQILAIRQEVFIIEQNCVYLDADGYDQFAVHLCGFFDGKIVAYARLFAPQIKYHEASIGRVLTTNAVRGKGIGKELMINALSHCQRKYPNVEIRISAQSYLEKFYNEFGFQAVSPEYLEDGIPHRQMLYHV
ncbi:MAG: GNAT family N-acetyltransferase [Ignavibacteria bacterium]|nr:GNAT family N-acetyltransferase [Ignavibacteria bacterium]